MTATTTEAGMAAGVTEVTEEAKGCQGHNTQIGDKRQDINANKRPWHGEDTGGAGGSSDGGGAVAGEQTHNHNHNGKILLLQQNNRSHHTTNTYHQQSQGYEPTYQLVPPDGGWGWMVALGTFIITTLLPMVMPCFGVLFSEYLLGEGSSSTTTAWIFNLQCFLWNTSALLVRPLTQEFGWRPVGVTCALIASVGMMISAFTPSPSFLFFSLSLMHGVAGGVVSSQCFTILPHYFERRRGVANGIMMSGVCMGQLVGPPIARFLQESYSFRGATFIIGALTLNGCIGATFFHPFEWHQKKVLLEDEPKESTPALPQNSKVLGQPNLNHDLVYSPSTTSFPGGKGEREIDDGLAVKDRLLERLEGQRTSCSSSRRSSIYNSTLSVFILDAVNFAALPLEDEPEKEEEKKKKEKEARRRDILPVRVVKLLIKDIRAAKSMRLCILSLGAMMCINGYLNFLMMVPFAMLEAGLSPDASATCITVSAGCNMVTRFLVSSLSDSPRFNNRFIYMSGLLLIATSIIAFTLLSSLEGLMTAMALFGCGVGANMGLYTIVIIDTMGVERLTPVYGTICFCVALGFISFGPLIGYIRDLTQSYTISIRFTAGMLLLGLTGWLFMGVAERVDRRREDNKALTEAVQKT